MEVVDFFGDFLENASLLLNYILDAFSLINPFNTQNPIAQGAYRMMQSLGIINSETSTAIAQNYLIQVRYFIWIGLFIGIISFAVGIFIRIAGSR